MVIQPVRRSEDLKSVLLTSNSSLLQQEGTTNRVFSFCHSCAQGQACYRLLPWALCAKVQSTENLPGPSVRGIQGIWGLIKKKDMTMRWQQLTQALFGCCFNRFAWGKVPHSVTPSRSYSLGTTTQKGGGQGNSLEERGQRRGLRV